MPSRAIANLAVATSVSAVGHARTHRLSLAPANKPNTNQPSKPQTSSSSQNAIKGAASSAGAVFF
ncbi:hypothetical protein EVJ58_g3029 [Rhodofomes roseus]|uniref:Uncharacterized protein n=1 Tax=Rhodofomes roseus TaxID=34475 RepID=A0A4Y9YPQ9_9APHY|nr:hypothetical protein EVJ58_g3029 [Rhodofomes roseus]